MLGPIGFRVIFQNGSNHHAALSRCPPFAGGRCLPAPIRAIETPARQGLKPLRSSMRLPLCITATRSAILRISAKLCDEEEHAEAHLGLQPREQPMQIAERDTDRESAPSS
jgi:hypothetical protein